MDSSDRLLRLKTKRVLSLSDERMHAMKDYFFKPLLLLAAVLLSACATPDLYQDLHRVALASCDRLATSAEKRRCRDAKNTQRERYENAVSKTR